MEPLPANTARFLGHSALVLDMGGVRVAFDVCSRDGRLKEPFANLIPGCDVYSGLEPVAAGLAHPDPAALAAQVDCVCFSHLHPDHFDVDYLRDMLAAAPGLQVIVPPGTRRLLSKPVRRVIPWWWSLLPRPRTVRRELLGCREQDASAEQAVRELLARCVEAVADEPVTVSAPGSSILLTPVSVPHPGGQLYVATPAERRSGVSVVGYRLEARQADARLVAFVIGESATDPLMIGRIRRETGPVNVFLPITDQVHPRGLKGVEEYVAHASAGAFATSARLLPPGSRVAPLHQGIWYFKVDEAIRGVEPEAVPVGPSAGGNGALPAASSDFWRLCMTARKRREGFRRLHREASSAPGGADVQAWSTGGLMELATQPRGEDGAPDADVWELAALEVDLGEYQTLRDEILNSWDWQKDVVVAQLGLFVGAVGIVEAFDGSVGTYLLVSFILSFIGMMLIEQSIRMTMIGRYFGTELIPRIRNRIARIAPEEHAEQARAVLGWETYFRNADRHTILMGVSATLGKYAFTVLPGFVSALVFVIMRGGQAEPLSQVERIGVAAAFALSALPLIVGAVNGKFSATGRD